MGMSSAERDVETFAAAVEHEPPAAVGLLRRDLEIVAMLRASRDELNPDAEAVDRMRAELFARIGQPDPAMAVTVLHPARSRRGRRLALAGAAAVVVVITAVGIGVPMSRGPAPGDSRYDVDQSSQVTKSRGGVTTTPVRPNTRSQQGGAGTPGEPSATPSSAAPQSGGGLLPSIDLPRLPLPPLTGILPKLLG